MLPLIQNTMTWRVMQCWRENYGLSMTAHLLCHVMERPWFEIREELLAQYEGGAFFRAISCPDIHDVAYYADYPFPVTVDPSCRIHNYPSYVLYSDGKIAQYPPEKGFINSWNGEGLKELKFRDVALTNRRRLERPTITPEDIIATLRGARHAA